MKRQSKKSLVPVSDLLSTEGMDSLFESANKAEDAGGVWAEPQLYQLPFCVPQDSNRYRTIKISEKVRLGDTVQERVFKVNPDPDWGLPGPFELEVMTVIYQLAAEEIERHGEVPPCIEIGSLRSFLKRMGRPMTGKYASILKDALKRLAATTCVSEGFFYSKPRDVYVIQSFQFITAARIAGEDNFKGGRFEKTTIEFHPFILENLNSSFRTLIDFDYLRSLKKDIAKSLFLQLSYRFHKVSKGEWEADYEWLANRMGLVVQADVRRAKDQLRSALQELKGSNFIESWEWLPNKRIRFRAGITYARQHAQRVRKRDSWVAHKEQEANRQLLIPRTQREVERMEEFDPLAPLCVEYAVKGWKAVAHKAKERGLSEEQLDNESSRRGHQKPATK